MIQALAYYLPLSDLLGWQQVAGNRHPVVRPRHGDAVHSLFDGSNESNRNGSSSGGGQIGQLWCLDSFSYLGGIVLL